MIHFHNADISYIIRDKNRIRETINWICERNKNYVKDINIILCSDDFLLDINKEHLDHDYYTDIITFDFSEGKNISGDLYISLDRIRENAKEFHVKHKTELLRVIFHGVWHLNGYTDKTKEQRSIMTLKENSSIKFFYSLLA